MLTASGVALAGATSGALALRPRGDARAATLARVLGIYIAISAGAIQLLDIVVDRLGPFVREAERVIAELRVLIDGAW